MAIEPLDPSYQQSLLFGPLRATAQQLREPNRPQGITVDPGQQPETSRDATGRTTDIVRRSRSSVVEEQTETLAQPQRQGQTSRLLIVDNAASNRADSLTAADPQSSQTAGTENLAFRRTTAPDASDIAANSSRKSGQPTDFERRTQLTPDPDTNAVFEFTRTDFDRPETVETNAQQDISENIGHNLERAVDPSNFDNVVITTGRIDRDEGRVQDNPIPTNELEQPIDDLDIPFNELSVEPLTPLAFAEYRVFEERARENPLTERDDDSDYGERPNNLEVIDQSVAFSEEQQRRTDPDLQDAAVRREREQALARELGRDQTGDVSLNAPAQAESTLNESSPDTQTTFEPPARPVTGMDVNPNPTGVETATTGFRDLEEPEARRPRIVSAILGTPENLIERIRVVNDLPVESDDIYGLDNFLRQDLLGIPPEAQLPLGSPAREEGERLINSIQELISRERAEDTNPGPDGPEQTAERNEALSQEAERTHYEQVTFTYHEMLGAQDFLYRTDPNVGTNFYFFA